MVRQKIVDRCVYLLEKKKALEESATLDHVEYGPAGLCSAWPTGMPRGTNDREAARFQRTNVNDALDKLEKVETELERLLQYLEQGAA